MNQRFLNLSKIVEIYYFFGFVFPAVTANKNTNHFEIKLDSLDEISCLLSLYCDNSTLNSIEWAPPSLLKKCCDPTKQHYLHQFENNLVVTTVKKKFGFRFFVIKAMTCNGRRDENHAGELSKLLKAVARFHKTPFFIYWGINSKFDGIKQAASFFTRSNKTISVQYGSSISEAFSFERIELIDLDIH